MHHRSTRALPAAAALALTLGACLDAPTSPAAARMASADQPARIVSSSGATLIPNSVKYRDDGGKPAQGRSGSAALEAFALMNKDGITELEFGPVPADPAKWWLRGIMTRAQIKALDADSTAMFTYNQNNLDTQLQQTQFGSLIRGQYLQVQANVTGIDPHRTDVVTVTERVKLRPDLAVQLQMTPQVPQDQPVPVVATVAELNGDVGARADCTLLVDGWESDRAPGIWVDAGDAVSCAFSYTFAPGPHDVQVEVTGVAPGEWDESNNRSDIVRIQAISTQTEFNYYAVATSQKTWSLHSEEVRWHNADTQVRGENRDETSRLSTTESAMIGGLLPRALSSRVTIELSQTTGGRVVHAARWTDFNTGCHWRWDGTVTFHICTYRDPYSPETWFQYVHNAGSATYLSTMYSREWDEGTGEELSYWYASYGESTDDGVVGFGTDYAFHVRIIDGDVVLTTDSEFQLRDQVSTWRTSDCGANTEPWEGWTNEWCRSFEVREEERRGEDSNEE